MPLSFLQPIDFNKDNYHPQQIGKKIKIHSTEEGMPNLENIGIAIIGLEQKQGQLHAFRKQWYKLFAGNWELPIADLGNLIISEQDTDTNHAIKELNNTLLKKNIITIFIGGKQRFTYGLYRGFDQLEQTVNLVNISYKFHFSHKNELFSEHSFMSKILSDSPKNLHDFKNIGYQSYYIAQEELDLMDKMLFESIRLGQATHDISIVEPALRTANLVSMNMKCIQAKDTNTQKGNTNGFSNREICTIARYSGISDNVQTFGLFNIPSTHLARQLAAQIIWYFCEGCNFRIPEIPLPQNPNYCQHTIPIEGYEIVFFQSHITNRWWLKTGNATNSNLPQTLIPCTFYDYEQATQGNIPEKWWNFYRKHTK